MTTKTIVLPPEAFFHARPAAQISAVAQKYQSVVMFALDVEIVDAKNAFSLMRMSRPNGRPLDLLADGPDEQEAMDEIESAIGRIFL